MNAREYMKDMNTKQKIDYIWYYYKVHIIVTLIAIFLIGTFVSDKINSKNYVLSFTVIGSSFNVDQQDEMQKEVTKLLLGKTDGKDQAYIDFMPLYKNSSGELTLQPELQQKFIVKMAAGEIDVAALDKNMFASLAANGGLVKLGDLKGLELNNNTTVKATNETGSEGVYGIDISSNAKLKEMNYDTENKVLCVTYKSENKDMAVKFINWLLK